MATIQGQLGGQNIGVNIPDFALDSTVEQVVQSIDRLNTQMGALLGGQDDVTLGDQRIAQAVNRLQESQDRDSKDSRRSIGEAIKSAPQEMMKTLKSDSVIEGFMRSMGLGMLATQFGMVQGAAATLGATFQFAGSVGLSYAGDIEKTQKRLAAVGLQLDDFGNAVAQNLGVMRTLGDSVDEGSQSFIGIVENFRNSSKEFGYFGLASGEMAELLGDELELRRRSMTAEQFRLYSTEQLNGAMMENFKLQEKMAYVTGQNVRERIRAQMAAKEDIRMQLAQMSMTEAQRKATDAVMGSFVEKYGKAGEDIRNAVIAGLTVPGQEFAGRGGQMAMMSPEIRAIIEQSLEAIRRGSDPEAAAKQIEQLMQDVRQNMDVGFLQTQIQAGNEFAAQIAQLAVTINDIGKTVNESFNDQMTDAAQAQKEYINTIRALTNDLSVTEATAANLVLKSILALGGLGSEADMVKNITALNKKMTDVMTSDITSGLITGFATALGQSMLGPFMRVATGTADGIDMSLVIGELGGAAGLPPQLVTALTALGRGRAGMQGLGAGLEEAFGDRFTKKVINERTGQEVTVVDFEKILDRELNIAGMDNLTSVIQQLQTWLMNNGG